MPDISTRKISLVIPVKDEAESIEALIVGIENQTRLPDEVIFVDGGSTDRTVEIVKRTASQNSVFKLIEIERATPGKGRNIGIEATQNDWIALTDGGMRLEPDWLEQLEMAGGADLEGVDIVYGNYAPDIRTFFDRCAEFAYVPAKRPDRILRKATPSSLMKKAVWSKVGGFPDLRAAEDLMFMEAAEAAGFRHLEAPRAMIHWRLTQGVVNTFKKFVTYSKNNVWAGRQWDWHYGVLKNYAVLIPIIFLAVLHSVWWLVALPIWLLARTLKRMSAFQYEYGYASLFNPLVVLGVSGLILTIDAATFIGWVQAKFSPQKL